MASGYIRPCCHLDLSPLILRASSARRSVTAFDGALRRYPCLGDGAVDNVPLNAFAFWASKRSQVLAQAARLDRRQRHWRTAIHALRTLVLCVEHESPPGQMMM